jgi:predicted enzyme related to lactoylglutathione lyase
MPSSQQVRQDGGVAGIGRLELVAFDALDIDTLATFYAELTGWTIGRKERNWITLLTPAGPCVAFQRAPDHLAPQWPGQNYPQQFHLDLDVDGLADAADRAITLGATWLAEGSSWITLADPAGHPFDLCQAPSDIAPMSRLWVSIDASDASALAHFYAALLGMEITHDGPEGSAISGDGKTVFFQPVGDYKPPRWPDPAHPQQAHLNVRVDDLDISEAQVLELGGSRLNGGGPKFRVFADPAGHPVCLTI